MRAVIDTGVLVSGLIRGQGAPGLLLRALVDNRFTAVYSTEMLIEVVDVLGRAKFHTKYHIQPDDIAALVQLIRLRSELVIPTQLVVMCRDPKDDKFLAAALAGKAGHIVTGDADLLVLSPYAGIPILSPAEFLTLLPLAPMS
jgi:putative PIN family toxin of toxin-antitoxin system